MRLWKTAALPGAALLLLAATAACGDDDSDDTTPTTTVTETATASTEETPTARPTTPAPTQDAETPSGGATPRCGADDLDLTILPAGGAAGTLFVALSVQNASGSDCMVTGYPGVSLVDANGDILGEPAERNTGVEPRVVVLASGESAHAMLGLPNHQNFPAGECEGPSASLVMYPPDELEAVTVPFENYACPGLSVRVFEPGANEPGR